MKINQIKQQVIATDADISGSVFKNVNLSGATFHDVNLAAATIDDVNMSEWRVRNVNLSGLQLSGADLTNASITESVTHGMTIDGIAVADMIASYRAAQPKP